jgi:hypothetical protein
MFNLSTTNIRHQIAMINLLAIPYFINLLRLLVNELGWYLICNKQLEEIQVSIRILHSVGFGIAIRFYQVLYNVLTYSVVIL